MKEKTKAERKWGAALARLVIRDVFDQVTSEQRFE